MQTAQSADMKRTREIAEEIYCSLPVVRLAAVASKSKCTIEQVKEWRDEYEWMEKRRLRFEGKRKAVSDRVGTKLDHAIEQLKTARDMREILQSQIEYLRSQEPRSRDTRSITDLADALRKIDQMIDKQFQFIEHKLSSR